MATRHGHLNSRGMQDRRDSAWILGGIRKSLNDAARLARAGDCGAANVAFQYSGAFDARGLTAKGAAAVERKARAVNGAIQACRRGNR